MQLYIGNKNYSSWSMRPWVLMREFALPFDEVMLRFDSMGPASAFKQRLATVSPAARVPVLVDGDTTVWDTLAIAEYLAEATPALRLWPAERAARARARSLCAEMHAGFGALRNHCPMNIEASLPEVGARILREQAGVVADLDRLVAMWRDALAGSGGPFLFGAYSIADAYFAPVAARIRTYALPVPTDVGEWLDRLWASRGVSAWVDGALAEQDFLDFEEPYRQQRE
jgi:glutathione S-transferase